MKDNSENKKPTSTTPFADFIVQHRKELWEYKKKETDWVRDKNQLEGNKKIIEDLSTQIIKLKKDLEKSPDYNDLLNMWRDEKKKREEAEGETTIVKGIGMNSPEMKAAQARIKELDNSLAIALELNDKHQRYNGKLQTQLTEVEEDNKKLSHQIEDKINQMRKSGM